MTYVVAKLTEQQKRFDVIQETIQQRRVQIAKLQPQLQRSNLLDGSAKTDDPSK